MYPCPTFGAQLAFRVGFKASQLARVVENLRIGHDRADDGF